MAGFTTTAKNQALNALAGVNPTNTWADVSLHSADPGLTGANELASAGYARQLVVWTAASGSQMVGSQLTFSIASGITIAYWGIWTLVSGGTYGFGEILPQSFTYTNAGTYILQITLTATG